MKSPICPKCDKQMHKQGFTPSGKQRWRCEKKVGGCDYSTTNPDTSVVRTQSGATTRKGKQPIFSRTIGKSSQRFVITSAQNATPAHHGFLTALKSFCDHKNAELLIVPIRYKNPTSRWSESQSNDETWAPELVPYLWNRRIKLNPNLVLLGDIKTQPTAASPLTGFDAITHAESGILAHTKLQLRCIPTLGKLPKVLTTTGAITKPNYTDSKAGRLGEFHHSLAACFVESSGKKFHMRQLCASSRTGEFNDLNELFRADGSVVPQPIKGLVMGDMHVGSTDPSVVKATFGKGGIVRSLNPEYLVYHDLFDGYSVNHHHGDNPFIEYAKHISGKGSARNEVMNAIDFIASNANLVKHSVVIPSNHDDFLRRWILSTDWRGDPENAEFYLETALAMLKSTKMTDSGTSYQDPFIYWLMKELGDRIESGQIILPSSQQGFNIAGIAVGMHGDAGPNGARGSIRNLRRIGMRSYIGHGHSPGIDEGCWQVGTSTYLRLEYNRGPSSWMQTHGVIYESGKRSLINMIDGDWRLR